MILHTMQEDSPAENQAVHAGEPAARGNAEFVQKYFKRSSIALVIITIGGQLFSDTQQTFLAYVAHNGAGYSFLDSGIMSAMYAIISAVFFILWGAISDNLRTRFGRRIPLIVSGTVITGILVIFFVYSRNFVWLVIDWGILIAIANSMTKVTGSLTADLIPLERRGRVNTVLQIVTPLGSLMIYLPSIVTLFGGSELEEALVITADMAIYCVIGIIAFLLVKEPPIAEPPRRIIDDIKKVIDWRELAKDKDFLKLFFAGIFLAAADNAIFLNFFSFISNLFATVVFDVPTLIIFGALAAAILACGMYFLSKAIDKIGRKVVTITAFGLAPIGAFMIALAGSSLIPLMLGFAIFFTFYLAGWSAISAWQQDILPKEARGRFFGILGISGAVGSAIGGIVAGLIADQYSIFWIFI